MSCYLYKMLTTWGQNLLLMHLKIQLYTEKRTNIYKIKGCANVHTSGLLEHNLENLPEKKMKSSLNCFCSKVVIVCKY